MKRVFSFILAAFMLVTVFPVSSKAAEKTVETIYYDDGSYMTVEVICSPARATWSVTGNKQYTYYESNGVAQWKAVLKGTFTYTGSSASCTESSVDVTIYNSAWYVGSKQASKSGNTAKASVTMKRTYNDVTATVPVSLTLTCDANGNLS